mgnify:FL=1
MNTSKTIKEPLLTPSPQTVSSSLKVRKLKDTEDRAKEKLKRLRVEIVDTSSYDF